MSTTDTKNIGSAWKVVARREVITKVLSPWFVISNVVSILAVIGFFGAQSYLDSRETTDVLIATAADTAMAEAVVAIAAADDNNNYVVDVQTIANDDDARSAITDGSADAWLHRDEGGGWLLTTKDSPNTTLQRYVTTAVQGKVLADTAAKANMTVEQVTQVSTVTSTQLEGNADKAMFGKAIGFAMAMVFYFATLMFGMQLSSSVAEEKSSRIVEIITTAIPIKHLLAGKVIANVATATVQVALLVGATLIGVAQTSYASFLPSVSASLGWFVVFFLVGFAAISTLFAVTGALASRTEDLQQTTMPMTFLMIAVFFSAFIVPEGVARMVLSYLPPFSAVLMPIRLAEGDAAWFEPIGALVGLVAFAIGTIAVASAMYQRSLLKTQGTVSLRQALSRTD